MRKLGFDRAEAYQDWCVLNGFSNSLDKDDDDRQSELMASLSNGPAWQSFANKRLVPRPMFGIEGRSEEEVVATVLEGKIAFATTCDKRYASLCAAVDRLRGADFQRDLEVFRVLINLLHERGTRMHLFSRQIPTSGKRTCCTFSESLALVAKCREQWIRPLQDWQVDSQNFREIFRSLVRHLFVRHSVPECLFNIWFHRDRTKCDAELPIFLHVAAGHSIRTSGIPMAYSRRMSHHFQQAPERSSLPEAIWWGHVRGKGGSANLAGAIMSSFLGRQLDQADFWGHVIDWFIKHPELDYRFVGPILDFVNNQRFGVGNPFHYAVTADGRRQRQQIPPAQPRLSMIGRTPAALIRDLQRWHNELARAGHSDISWLESKIRPFQWQSKQGTVWTIYELLGNGALAEEGRSLNHCVGSYAETCAMGRTTIWSMRQGCGATGKRVLTIQVDADQRRIVQVRGNSNRFATREEREVIEYWAWEAGLTSDYDA